MTRAELYELVWSKPISQLAQDLTISANGLTKICDRLHIPYPSRGYWNRKPDNRPPRPPLSPRPDLDDEPVVLASGRSRSRRKQTRMLPEERREQLMNTAIEIVGEEGIHAASLKRIARDAGVSEALVFRYFRNSADLLTAIARREIEEMRETRHSELRKGKTPFERVRLSTAAYLQLMEERGAILQQLLNVPEVRRALRGKRRQLMERGSAAAATSLIKDHQVPQNIAQAATLTLTAVSRRAGKLLALRKATRADCERVVMAMIARSNRDLVRDPKGETSGR